MWHVITEGSRYGSTPSPHLIFPLILLSPDEQHHKKFSLFIRDRAREEHAGGCEPRENIEQQRNNREIILKGVFDMTREEQETIIRWDRAGDSMSVYTCDPALIRRLRGLPAYKLEKEYRQGGDVVACDFTADRRLLTLRSKRATMTEEQREANRERLRKMREQTA